LNLVDELYLLVYPLTVGSGKRALPDGVQATFGLRSVHHIATILGVTGLMDEAGLKSAGVRITH